MCKNAKDGEFINKLKVNAGDYVDAITIECSNDDTKYDV